MIDIIVGLIFRMYKKSIMIDDINILIKNAILGHINISLI